MLSDQDRLPVTAATRPFSLFYGVALCGAIAAAALWLRGIPGAGTFSPLILSILLGMAFQNIAGTPAAAKPGISFSMKRLLRLGVMLLGFQLTAHQIAEVGISGATIVLVSLVGCFLFTVWAGRQLGVERKLTELIAAGTAICGASAVIATNAVTEASDEDTCYAVVCVTMFGTVAMFLYPVLGGVLHLGAREYGLWTGASVHEVAQVVAAAYQHGKSAGDYATITKLTRVIMLAPMVIALGAFAARKAERENRKAAAPAPWFVAGFLAAVALNSIVVIPAGPKAELITATSFILSVALAALGLETDARKMRLKGARPLLLGAAASAFISVVSFVLVKITV